MTFVDVIDFVFAGKCFAINHSGKSSFEILWWGGGNFELVNINLNTRLDSDQH